MQRLTKRQQTIAILQGQGLSYKQIADRLGISVSAVKTHLSHSLSRTGTKSGHELQHEIRLQELRDIAAKIQDLLNASARHVETMNGYLAIQDMWPKRPRSSRK